MKLKDIEKAVREELESTNLGPFRDLRYQDRLGPDLGLDSLERLETVMNMSKQLKIDVSDEEYDVLCDSEKTFGDLVEYFKEKLSF